MPSSEPRPDVEGASNRALWRPSLGAWPEGDGARFRVWAPGASAVEVVIEGAGQFGLTKQGDGTFSGFVGGLGPGVRYRYLVDGRGPFPDPASRSQPEGVHGPSELIDPGRFAWTDRDWKGLNPDHLVVYELHVGTFSPEGTFDGVRERLPYLRELGVTAIELMPVADFAGARSWGYDGVDLYAPSRNYGPPDDLRRLVDAAHGLGLGVFLDVVYNHFGPVGNYALSFSPLYLSPTHSSAWAACVNLDGEGSEMVRQFFIENARHWVHEYHLDGLRLDATHALIDDSPTTLVAQLVDEVQATVQDRRVLIVAEDHRNLNAMLRPRAEGGWGLDAVWADDLHHEIRRHLHGDDEGYYRDYTGSVPDIAATINAGWFYTGQVSTHLGEPRGTEAVGFPKRACVVCLQNHDQVGNRALGDRLHHAIDPAAYRAASALLLCGPETPLLFMGQEWAATAPFQYFTDHDEELGKVVTEGRRREFAHFRAFSDPASREQIPDPQAASTFERSKLDWSEPGRDPHASVLRLYQALLALRANEPALRAGAEGTAEAIAVDAETLLLRRDAPGAASVGLVVRFRGPGTVDLAPHLHAGREAGGDWDVVLTTEDPPFAPDAAPPSIELSGPAPVVRFERAGAVVLRRRPVPAPILKG
jgi:maltooligosyltrehalose trehalohydrolase